MTDPTIAAQADSGGSYVTALEHADGGGTGKKGKPRSLWSDAWGDLRRRPLFIIASVIILFLIVVAVFPEWFTSADPNHRDLSRSRQTPSSDALFGYDVQGQDIFARAVYGTRWSLLVGVGAAVFTVVIGAVIGLLAGYFGGAVDGFLSRVAEVFFGLPFVLGAIIILNAFRSSGVDSAFALVMMVVFALSLLSWPVAMRIMRSAAISAKQQDYVKAARALGASAWRIIFRHMLPNCLAPILVYATILLGSFIAVEATLSFLGIGLRDPAVSWGVMISDARNYIRVAPHLLLFPAGILTITVLAFVMLGDAVRDALDPKLR
ncbi:peptide ABC transporter permease [Actinophytocola xinjiangensis]|uniref:Peptide ABC transporter permease n=1 Tax=Actinophytocola xinjiangensis TaxID=485602 RepID=A0A7Z1AZR9_9PSEU|nr:ABC transporter permease [Actinophytocola xinjiangensis]OLF11059.1 peptide ABC transporter permease [Actinophytocola xinjiangensis]